jgi:hypothetical protein
MHGGKKLPEDLGVGGRIILKLMLMIWVEEVWVDHLVGGRYQSRVRPATVMKIRVS